jgi:hypothetical protein
LRRGSAGFMTGSSELRREAPSKLVRCP